MQYGSGVWAVMLICWKCIYLDFSSFLAVKVSRAAVQGKSEIHVKVFAETSHKEIHPCIALFDLQLIGLNKKLTVQVRQNKRWLIFALARFQAPLWSLEAQLLLLGVFSLYMCHLRHFSPGRLLPAQTRSSSEWHSAEPANSLVLRGGSEK